MWISFKVHCKYLHGLVSVETVQSYLCERPCSCHGRCIMSDVNVVVVKAPTLVTLGIPNIHTLYVPSVSHECSLQGVACLEWDSALRKPPQQVSMQVFPQLGYCGMSN